jgi:cellulose synthase/poly-beta-1,6-N-acetylglucosamine synthase-like glycosyltransferase
MVHAAEIVFWVCLGILIYTYVGYPMLMFAATALRNVFKQPRKIDESSVPPVSLIITAYNEEDIIEDKIQNIKQLDYPSDKLQVIVVTDGSNDNTHTIVQQHSFVQLLHDNQRRGKLAAMNRAIDYAKHEIVIFNDANGFLNNEALKKIVRHYADPKVGAVSGEKKIIKSGGSVSEGEGLYWKYESMLKRLDSDLKTIVGAAGELFSIRRSLYIKLNENIVIEDFVQSLLLCRRGYVVRYEPEAWSAEVPSLNIEDEMERKTRISAGAFQAMVILLPLLNFFKHPLLTFMYVSHRVLRWTLGPLAMLLLLVSNCLLVSQPSNWLYRIALAAQVIFYVMTLIGWRNALAGRKQVVFYFPFYFVFMNWCVFAGLFRYIGGGQQSTWKRVARA